MSDLEKRAHDIAVRILPYTLKEFKPDFTYLSSDEVLRAYLSVQARLLKNMFSLRSSSKGSGRI